MEQQGRNVEEGTHVQQEGARQKLCRLVGRKAVAAGTHTGERRRTGRRRVVVKVHICT